jgi:hypothetical protein
VDAERSALDTTVTFAEDILSPGAIHIARGQLQ